MSKKQQKVIRELKEDILDLKKEIKASFKGVGGFNGTVLICGYCCHPINQKPESKKEKNKRIMEGIDELIRRGVLS